MISRPSQNFKTYAAAAVLAGDVDLTLAAEIGGVSRAIYCEQAGTLVVTRVDGTNVSIPFTAGALLPVVAKGLIASGSTAKGILVMG